MTRRSQGHEGTDGGKDSLWKGSDFQTDNTELRPRSAGCKWAEFFWWRSLEQSRKWESGCSTGQPGQTGAACGADRNMWNNIHWNLIHWANSQSKRETGLSWELALYSNGLKVVTTGRAPKAQETSGRGRGRSAMARRWAGMLQQAVFMAWHGMAWLLHLWAHSTCGFLH